MSARVLVTLLLFLCTAVPAVIAAPQNKRAKTPKDRVTEFCRQQALARLKYVKTVEWLDVAKEEAPGVWMISGVRTAKSPSGNTDQQYTCRVSLQKGTSTLKMIQIFKEASKTGRDIFEVH